MENIEFERNYEKQSVGAEDKFLFEQMAPGGFFESFQKKLDAIPKVIVPEDKANFVQQEKEAGRRVVMVGDGINDSPALSAADVGIAISDGSELAREIADITVGADSLQELVYLCRLSKEMMRRIHVNYRAILGINGSLIAAGVTGLIQPTTSALLHNTTTLALSLRSMSWKVPGEAGQE